MATRCNIIIKKGDKREILYHHYDGYPSGVGLELQEFINRDIECISDDNTNITTIAHELERNDCSYESNEVIHGDIGYLYVIDCDTKNIHCHNIRKWDIDNELIENIINGTAEETEEIQLTNYNVPFTLSTDKFKEVIKYL